MIFDKMLVLFVILIFPFFITDVGSLSCWYMSVSGVYPDCSHTNITLFAIPDTLPENIDSLNINGHNITTLDYNNFRRFSNLYSVQIEYSKIKTINKDTFTNLTTLKYLWLEGNNIQDLPDAVFTGHQQIREIDVSQNSITGLQRHLFFNMPKLDTIYLNDNKINNISKECFVNLPSLVAVSLSENNLKTLDTNIIDKPTQLQYFYLNDNPWDCDKYLCLVMRLIANSYEFIERCDTPVVLKNKAWFELVNTNSRISTDYSVYEGQTATLQCHHCDLSHIIWKHQGTLWTKTNISVDSITSSLILHNVNKRDEGEYSCHIDSDRESTVSSINLQVKKNIPSLTYSNPDTGISSTETVLQVMGNYNNNQNSGYLTAYLIIGGIVAILLITVGIFILYRRKCIRRIDKQEEEELNTFSFLSGPDPVPFPPPRPGSTIPTVLRNNTASAFNNTSTTGGQTPDSRRRRADQQTNRRNQQTTNNQTSGNEQTETHSRETGETAGLLSIE